MVLCLGPLSCLLSGFYLLWSFVVVFVLSFVFIFSSWPFVLVIRIGLVICLGLLYWSFVSWSFFLVVFLGLFSWSFVFCLGLLAWSFGVTVKVRVVGVQVGLGLG